MEQFIAKCDEAFLDESFRHVIKVVEGDISSWTRGTIDNPYEGPFLEDCRVFVTHCSGKQRSLPSIPRSFTTSKLHSEGDETFQAGGRV